MLGAGHFHIVVEVRAFHWNFFTGWSPKSTLLVVPSSSTAKDVRRAFALRHRLREEAVSLWREGSELSDEELVAFYHGRYVHEPALLLSLARPGLRDASPDLIRRALQRLCEF